MSAPKPLAEEAFTLAGEAEVGLELTARSPGASWGRKGAEAAAALVEVDGKYNQDLLLWAGDRPFTYRLALGRLPRGRHVVTVRHNPARSSAGAAPAEVVSLKTLPLPAAAVGADSTEEALALSYSPVLYARANSIDRFTDVPLLMYYQVERNREEEIIVRYTVVFSHEDGGTPAAALMARWGRATDIEWVYEARFRGGRLAGEKYQGVEHETKEFTGERALGSHPLLAVASDNNNFSDLACSKVRFAPLPARAELGSASREALMDEHPWTYRVMAEELSREGRVADSPADPRVIADPRQYLYVEAYAEQEGAALSFDVEVEGQAKRFASDSGDHRLRIDRTGFFRSAVRLASPAGDQLRPVSVTIRCHATGRPADRRACGKFRLTRAQLLDDEYIPQPLRLSGHAPRTLAPGESMVVTLSRADSPSTR